MLLSLINHLNSVNSEVRNKVWEREKNRGTELKGKVMAIIGYGYMGKAFAQRLNGFEMEVIAYDKYISGFGNNHVKEVNLEEIFQRADFVSLHTFFPLHTNILETLCRFTACFDSPMSST